MSAFVKTMAAGRELPDGCDTWGFRLNQAGGESRHGFVWPREGWVEAPGPILDDNEDACPMRLGDGICAATEWGGVTLNYPPGEVALVAWRNADALGSDDFGKVRLRRAYVVAVVPLRSADLSDANLRRADLSGADLSGADLSDADLSDADLSDADLSYANLFGAALSYANLSGANLRDADLSYADLRYADLRDADLSNAHLNDADLSDAHLSYDLQIG